MLSLSEQQLAAVERAVRLAAQAMDVLDAASVLPELTAPLEHALAELRAVTPNS